MNATVEIAGSKPRQRQAGTARIRSSAFSWLTAMNVPTQEQNHVRSVSRRWRALMTDTKP